MRADLVNAEVGLDSVAWRKPKGRRSVFEFDVGKGTGAYPTELHNVRLVGDDVAIEGWMGIGADNKVKEFRFPNFSLNVITSLETHGKVRPDGVWDVTAKGPTYDGRELFRSFFDVAHQVDPNAKIRPGLDLNAEIATVVGFTDTTLRNVKMTLQKRSNKLTGLDVRGTLEGGKAFAAVVRQEPGRPRTLLAEAQDAGQLFKLVGFYPNAVGGMMNLEVNLDGEGAAERTGTLWARDFHVLGDPIVIEVLQSADSNRSERRNVVRQQFDFEIMRVPFSVGHGQFVMHNAAINGPLEGATLRGKVDFRAQRIDVGGTYVGGTGLMQVLASIPAARPDADRPARGGRVRHHVRHPGHDGQPAGDRQSAGAAHARHLPRDLPDDRRGPARGAARAADAEAGRRTCLERAGLGPSGWSAAGAGRSARGRRELVGRDAAAATPSASSTARSAQISPIRGTHPRRARAPGVRPCGAHVRGLISQQRLAPGQRQIRGDIEWQASPEPRAPSGKAPARKARAS